MSGQSWKWLTTYKKHMSCPSLFLVYTILTQTLVIFCILTFEGENISLFFKWEKGHLESLRDLSWFICPFSSEMSLISNSRILTLIWVNYFCICALSIHIQGKLSSPHNLIKEVFLDLEMFWNRTDMIISKRCNTF